MPAEPKDILRSLVRFDTTSDRPNKDMAAYIQTFLDCYGFSSELVFDHHADKASLIARIGPETPGGVLLSAHMDTVSANPGEWLAPPHSLRESEGRYYGLGTADMKGFIACALSEAPAWRDADLKKPIYLVLSYNEETDQAGILNAIPALVKKYSPSPEVCIIGEPTGNRVATGHLSLTYVDIAYSGTTGHTSEPYNKDTTCPFTLAGRFWGELDSRTVRDRIGAALGDDVLKLPAVYAVTVAATQKTINTMPPDMGMQIALRGRVGITKREIEDVFHDYAHQVLIKYLENKNAAAAGKTSIRVDVTDIRPGYICADWDAMALAEQFADRTQIGGVSYRCEAPHFAMRGFTNVVICGPGDIKQAHRPNEYIEKTQLEGCQAMLRRVLDYCCR